MSKFKVGDIVSPYDGSFSVGADNKGFAHKCGIEMEDRKFKVVDTGLRVTPMGYDRKFHTDVTRSDGTPAYPDMLIQALDNGEYVFVISDFVKEIPQPVPFMEAVKAYSEGKKIRCEVVPSISNQVYEYDPDGNEIGLHGYKLATREGMCTPVTTKEILEGKWFIEE